MASFGPISFVMNRLQNNVTTGMKKRERMLADKADKARNADIAGNAISQRDLLDFQLARELTEAVDKANHDALAAIGDGMSIAARGANK
jgi:hypothetical protein